LFTREIAAPVSDLKGAGPAIVARLSRLGVYSGADLLTLAPRDYEDRSAPRLLAEFGQGPVNCRVLVVAHDWFGFGRMRTLKVWVEDEQVRLTALEFKLLQTFVERKGRVQTRDSLLSDVWGMEAEITTRTVDTHVKRLRDKLGAAGTYIETIRGVGYRLQTEPHED